jgi:hypothetical protein
MSFEDVRSLKEAHGAIDGGDADTRIDLRRAMVYSLDIRVVLRLGQHLCYHAALLGHLEAKLFAEPFNTA